MIVVQLTKFRHRPTKADLEAFSNHIRASAAKGIKIQSAHYTLGRYDAVLVVEGPDEKSLMEFAMKQPDVAATETLVAVNREEAIKLLG